MGVKRWLHWRIMMRPQVQDYWSNDGTTFERERWHQDMWYWRSMRPEFPLRQSIYGTLILVTVISLLVWLL